MRVNGLQETSKNGTENERRKRNLINLLTKTFSQKIPFQAKSLLHNLCFSTKWMSTDILFFKNKWAKPGLFFIFVLFSHRMDKYSTNLTMNEKKRRWHAWESNPGVAGWKEQMNPLSYGSTLDYRYTYESPHHSLEQISDGDCLLNFNR